MPTARDPLTAADLAVAGQRLGGYARIVLAISGGADSLCLLPLAAELARSSAGTREIVTATFVHGWRAEAEAEAATVAACAARFGFAHRVLRPDGHDPLPRRHEDARDARYSALAHLARSGATVGTAAVVTAHHLDDQAETVLMRLGRGSGVDGLSAMASVRTLDGDRQPRVDLVRPFLELPKARLVATVSAAGIAWIEDPSNADASFERPRVRAALAQLAGAGITAHAVANSAHRLGRARRALDALTCDLGRRSVRLHDGAFAEIAARDLLGAPVELQIRLLGRLIGAYGAPDIRPRLSDYERVQTEVARGSSATLAGAIIRPTDDRVQVFREPGRTGLPRLTVEPGGTALWDGRFVVTCQDVAASCMIGAVPVEQIAAPGSPPADGRIARPAGLPQIAVAGLPAAWTEDGRLRGVLHPTFAPVAGLTAAFRHADLWERDGPGESL